MKNWYTNRDNLKDACGIPAASTGDHDQIDMCLETVSRLIDDWVGFHFYTAQETRYYQARETWRLRLDAPLTSITTLQTDYNGDGVYEVTWSTTGYYLSPANAALESPPQPYWAIELKPQSTAVFPVWAQSGLARPNLRGVQLLGAFGYYDQHEAAGAKLDAALDATSTSFALASATSLHPGQTILVDSEQMFINEIAAAASGPIAVQRGVNGTSGAAHSSGVVPEVYRYPMIERASLYQAQHDFRHGLAESAGGVAFGHEHFSNEQTLGGLEGDLHPAVRRMLRSFRVPVIG